MTNPEVSLPTQKPGGLFENLIEVLFAPSRVFDRTRASTAGKYAVVTAVIVFVIILATRNLLQPWFDAQASLSLAQAAKKGTPMPEGAASATRAFIGWGFLGTAVLATLIGPYLNAAFLRFGAKLANASLSFSQAAMIAVLAGVPRLLNYLFMPAQTMVLDAESARGLSDLSLSAARFVDPATTSTATLGLLSILDVTRAWQLVLAAIGVSVVARVSMAAGMIAGAVMLAVGIIIFQLLPAAFA